MGDPIRFESWIDRQVREAIERGEFDNLPGAGKPLKLKHVGDPDWWIKSKLEDEDLTAVLPPPIALRRAKENLQATLAGVRTEAEAREIIESLNDQIRELNINPITEVRIITALVDVEAALDEWRAGSAG